MSALHLRKLSLLTLLVVSICVPALTCEAQQRVYNNPSYTGPPAPLTHAELKPLANMDLAGPRTAMAAGPLLLATAPFIATAVWLTDTGGDFPLAAVTLAAMATGGIGLLAYGVKRSREIKRARLELARGASVSIGPRQAVLGLRFTY